MTEPVIRVEKLGKQYQIGTKLEQYETLRDSLNAAFTAPFRRVRGLFYRNGMREPQAAIWALKDISFDVRPGEVVGIVGRNGAGKSTLLKILSRITDPTEGRAVIRGRVGSLLEVGTGFHPELTGRENIYLNGAILGMKRAEINRKFDEIVAFSEIDKFIDTPVKRYSSGMYVRLAFAVAAHLEPEILLVDEVLSVGDASFQKKCLGKMSDVAQGGRTVLFVSHNMAAVQNLCPRSILLNEGRNIVDSNTNEVLGHYLTSIKDLLDTSNLAQMPRVREDYGTQVRIVSCRVLDAHMNPTNTFARGEAINVEITCQVFKPVSGVAFLVGIDSILEQRIMTITSFEAGKQFSAEAGQVVVGLLQLSDLLLMPGNYYLTLGLLAPSYGFDSLPSAIPLEIADVSHATNIYGLMKHGFMQLKNPNWKIDCSNGDNPAI